MQLTCERDYFPSTSYVIGVIDDKDNIAPMVDYQKVR
jgi:hypothetical protein